MQDSSRDVRESPLKSYTWEHYPLQESPCKSYTWEHCPLQESPCKSYTWEHCPLLSLARNNIFNPHFGFLNSLLVSISSQVTGYC